MKHSLLLIISALLLTACGGETNSSSESETHLTHLQLNKAEANYLAYKIADEKWIEINEAIEITITNTQTLTLATICTDEESESYYGYADIYDANSLALAILNLDKYSTQCGYLLDTNDTKNKFTIISQQDDISISSVSVPGATYWKYSEAFKIDIPSEIDFNIAVIGISIESDIYIYSKPDINVKSSENFTIDFYDDNSTKLINGKKSSNMYWDESDLYYDVDNLWIPLSSSSFSNYDDSLVPLFFEVPEEIATDSGRYYNILNKATNVNDYFLHAGISSKTLPEEIILPEDLSELNQIKVIYNANSDHYTLSLPNNIDPIIPLPLQSLSITHTSYKSYDFTSVNSSYSNKSQQTTSHLKTTEKTISLMPIKFHLLPNSPISELTDGEINSKSTNIEFFDEDESSGIQDYYKLSRHLKELVNNEI